MFQRERDLGVPDVVIGGIYVDRELYSSNTEKMALFRYFLEPLGVSIDKWSMGVRGRSRTYTFADVFGSYLNVLIPEMRTALGLPVTADCSMVIPLVNASLGSLPGAADPPTYTDVQRIFNKSCIECHGDLRYPPYENAGSFFNIAEEENPPMGVSPLVRPHSIAELYSGSLMGLLYRYIIRDDETCPPVGVGMMPCGGPKLTGADIETIRRWIVGGALYTEGDPHIKTIDGVHYDFQSAGEFVLLRDPGMEIQARQTAVETGEPLPPNPYTGLRSCVSINTAAAVRVGPHRITVQPNPKDQSGERGMELRIDGKLTDFDTGEIRLPAGGRIVRATSGGNLQVESPGGTVVIITSNWWAYRQLWYVNINVRQARGTEGVMGAIAPRNWLPALPDGTQLGPRPADLHQRYVDLYETFEKAWRVRPGTSLFDYAPGESTATFTFEEWPYENPTRCDVPPHPSVPPGPSVPQKPLDWKTATQICADIIDEQRRFNCIQDVMVTGEPGFAEAYVQTEEGERNEFPTPPDLDAPADRVTVKQPMTFAWGPSKDPDGDRVTYRQCIWPVDRKFTLNDCEPKPLSFEQSEYGMRKRTMTRTPAGLEMRAGQSYFWKVIAEDERGGMTESETRRIDVR